MIFLDEETSKKRVIKIDTSGPNVSKSIMPYNSSGNINYEYEVEKTQGTDHSKTEHILRVETKRKDDSVHTYVQTWIDQKDVDTFVLKKHVLVKEVVEEYLHKKSSNSKFELNYTGIDSTLTIALGNQGINAYFNFGIVNEANQFVFLDDSSSEDFLLNSQYKAQLFPDNIFQKPNFLLLNFPNKKSYIIQSMWGMLSLSLILIFVIIGVFYKTVEMLVKQKKVAEMKNDLINNITHEFKTPISTISVACDTLNEPEFLSNSEIIKKYSGIIKEENGRLTQLVENLLNTASMEKSEIELKSEILDVHEVIEGVLKNFSSLIEEKGVKIKTGLFAANSTLKGDKFHFSNVISNLIDNAIKYSSENPKIVVETEENENLLMIMIRDNGIGISKNHLPFIFDTFYRVPTGNIHNVKGYGIGLSYVKNIIEAMDAEIIVESELNSGSRFLLKFSRENDEN